MLSKKRTLILSYIVEYLIAVECVTGVLIATLISLEFVRRYLLYIKIELVTRMTFSRVHTSTKAQLSPFETTHRYQPPEYDPCISP